jgi:hypothetical protein
LRGEPMRLKVIVVQTLASSLVAALLLGGACTEPPIGDQGSGRHQDLPPLANDAGMLVDAESGVANLPGLCVPDTVICHKSSDCCNGDCSTETSACSSKNAPVCAPDGVVCEFSSDCCDGYCGMGVCGATPAPTCVPEGIYCTTTTDCCNPESDGSPGTQCMNNVCCGLTETCGAAPLCIPYGILCHDKSDSHCCIDGGACTQLANGTFVCDIPPK